MIRGRPAIPKSSTKYLNAKRRVIFITADGKYVAKSNKGSTVYNPKARFVKSPGGTTRAISNSNGRVPTAIRAKVVRKVRADRGKARPKAGQVHRAPIGPRRPVGRPRKARASPFNMGIAAMFGGRPVRKQRANKGVKRGARVGKGLLRKNPFAGLA